MRVLAIGGGGFQEEGPTSPVDDYIVHLTGARKPRICLLATPSGDRPQWTAGAYACHVWAEGGMVHEVAYDSEFLV